MNTILEKLIPVIASWLEPISIIFYFLGVILIVIALIQLSSKNQSGKPVLSGLAGIILLNFPTFIDNVSYTVFNSGSEKLFSYAPPTHPGSIYIQFTVYAVQLIGVLGFGRGCWLLRDTANGQPQVMRGFIHFIGSIFAVNIVQFIKFLGISIGGDTQSTISTVFGN